MSGADAQVASLEVGPYLIEREAEFGGAGVVTLLARRQGVLGFEKPVLLHVAEREADDPRLVARARAEMRLSHAGLARVIDVGHAPLAGAERHYAVSERPRGESLQSALARPGNSPAAVALALLARVFDVVEHVHRRAGSAEALAHGALTPAALWVTPEGDVTLAGLVTLSAEEPRPGDDVAALRGLLRVLVGEEAGAPLLAQLEGETVDLGNVADLASALAFKASRDPAGRDLGRFFGASGSYAEDARRARIAVDASADDVARLMREGESAGLGVERSGGLIVDAGVSATPLERAVDVAFALAERSPEARLVVSLAEEAPVLPGGARPGVWLSGAAARVALLGYVLGPERPLSRIVSARISESGPFIGPCTRWPRRGSGPPRCVGSARTSSGPCPAPA